MFIGCPLTNSPSTFQMMVNDIFQDLIMEGVVCVYLDNILIFTKCLEEHHRITRLVLEWLCDHKLFLKHEKCKFEQTTIEYLGLIILEGKMHMDPVKVTGMMDWLTPTKKKEVQFFLGFTNFYHQFIKGFFAPCKTTVQTHEEGLQMELGRRWAMCGSTNSKNTSCPLQYYISQMTPKPFTSKWIVQILQQAQSFHNNLWTISSGTQSHSTQNPWTQLSETMKSMTRRCWQ